MLERVFSTLFARHGNTCSHLPAKVTNSDLPMRSPKIGGA